MRGVVIAALLLLTWCLPARAMIPVLPTGATLFTPGSIGGGPGTAAAVTLAAVPANGIVYNSGDTLNKSSPCGTINAQNTVCMTWNSPAGYSCSSSGSQSIPNVSGGSGSSLVTVSNPGSAPTNPYAVTCNGVQATAQDFAIYPAGFFASASGSGSSSGGVGTACVFSAPCSLGGLKTALEANNGSGATAVYGYLLGGTYAASNSGGSCAGGTGGSAMNLGTADSHETWQFYPPAGYDSAVIEGGTTIGSASLACGFDIEVSGQTDNMHDITVNGLTIQIFKNEGIVIVGGNHLTFENNKLLYLLLNTSYVASGSYSNNQNVQDPVYSGGINIQCGYSGQSGLWHDITITHNYEYDIGSNATRVNNGSNGAYLCGSSNTPANFVETYNIFQDTCTLTGDCGAMYFTGGLQGTSATNELVEYNYVVDVDLPQARDPADGIYQPQAIYWDGNNAYFTAKGNVATGNLWDCYGGNGLGNGSVVGNICDLTSMTNNTGFNGTPAIMNLSRGGFDNQTDEVNDEWANSIVIANSSSSGGGYQIPNSPSTEPIYVANNTYFNWGSAGSINYNCSTNMCTTSFGGSGNASADVAPNYQDPKIAKGCWAPMIQANSPVYNTSGTNPTAFPALPAGWGSAGFWGPPGFTHAQAIAPGGNPSWQASNNTTTGTCGGWG